MDEITALIVLFIVLAIYFIPNWIASGRQHHQANAIFWVNLLLGWTVFGWLAAFIWSLTAVNPDLQTDNKMPCPHCAEPIMRAAKVCKHCGRDIEHQKPVKKQVAHARPLSVATPDKVARAEAYGIKKVRGRWMFEGQQFGSLDIALKYAEARERSGASE